MTTDLSTFADGEFSMRYKEPFITAGLNKKFAVALPRGIYRGFQMTVDPLLGDRTVTIEGDPDTSDHMAVYQTETGYSLTIRRTSSPSFLLSLTAYDSETVLIVLYATYALGATTEVILRAYTEAEYAAASEKDELVILGKVDVPAAGNNVTASMINYDSRTLPWANAAPGSVPWTPVLRNSGFEWSDDVNTPRYELSAIPWRSSFSPDTSPLIPSKTGERSGYKCMALEYTSGDTSSFSLTQYVWVPVSAGQRYRVRFYKRMVQAATAGTLDFAVSFVDKDGNLISTVTESLGVTADADYVEFDKIYEVPNSGLEVVGMRAAGVVGSGLQFAATGDAIRFDDFQIWVETEALDRNQQQDMWPEKLLSALALFDSSADFGDLPAQPFIHHTGGNVKIERVDKQTPHATMPGLELLGQLLVGAGLNSDDDARIQTAPRTSGRYTLIWQGTDPVGSLGTPRMYHAHMTGTYGVVITFNAKWSYGLPNRWYRDTAGSNSVALIIGRTRLSYLVRNAADSDGWTETGWSFTGAEFAGENGGENRIDKAPTHLGEDMLGTVIDAATARLVMPRADDGVVGFPARTMLWESDAPNSSGGNFPVRCYRANDNTVFYDSLEFVVNASWDAFGSQWRVDNNSFPAQRLLLGDTGLELQERVTVAPPWADNVFDETFHHFGRNYYAIDDGRINFRNSGPNTNPNNTAIQVNRLTAKNCVKAWANITTGGSPTVNDGFNLEFDAPAYSGTDAQMTFPSGAMNNNDYVVLVTDEGGTPIHNKAHSLTTSTFLLRYWVDGGGSPTDLSSNVRTLMCMVLAEDTST